MNKQTFCRIPTNQFLGPDNLSYLPRRDIGVFIIYDRTLWKMRLREQRDDLFWVYSRQAPLRFTHSRAREKRNPAQQTNGTRRMKDCPGV